MCDTCVWECWLWSWLRSLPGFWQWSWLWIGVIASSWPCHNIQSPCCHGPSTLSLLHSWCHWLRRLWPRWRRINKHGVRTRRFVKRCSLVWPPVFAWLSRWCRWCLHPIAFYIYNIYSKLIYIYIWYMYCFYFIPFLQYIRMILIRQGYTIYTDRPRLWHVSCSFIYIVICNLSDEQWWLQCSQCITWTEDGYRCWNKLVWSSCLAFSLCFGFQVAWAYWNFFGSGRDNGATPQFSTKFLHRMPACVMMVGKQISWSLLASHVVDTHLNVYHSSLIYVLCPLFFQKQRHRCVASPLRCFPACFRCLYSFKLRWKDDWKWFPRMAGTITYFLLRFCWILFGHPWATSGIPFCDCT